MLLTLWSTNIAIENGPFIIYIFFPLKMVIFHSYVSLPEGSIIPYHQQGFSITAQLASCRYALLSNGKMDHLTA